MNGRFTWVAALCLLAACRNVVEKDTGPLMDDTGTPVDIDQDGAFAAVDCDDNDANVHPGAEETCDGLDNDCDGLVDEDVLSTWYIDADEDGHGDPLVAVEACTAPSGHVMLDDDCDDGDAGIYPGAEEVCDTVDNDCDGEVDEGLLSTWFADADGDGHGAPEANAQACEAPSGHVALGDDCDDTSASAYPGATEVCDELDNDCDGEVDEGQTTTYYPDADGDGYGVVDSTSEACTPPTGYSAIPGDCDDDDGAVNPEASERCNGVDDDCDDTIDEADAVDASTWYADADGDGYGDAGAPTVACDQPSGHEAVGSDTGGFDCDDLDASVYPGASEVCNGLDDDCDGDVDEDPTDGDTWYPDVDGDGYGDPDAGVIACEAPDEDHGADASDCDDGDARIFPGSEEICNGADSDCDGTADEDCVDVIEMDPPSEAWVDSPAHPYACADIGEMSSAPSSWIIGDLPAYMDMLYGVTSGLTESTSEDVEILDWSIRCGSDYSASEGNFSPTTPWPVFTSQGSYGGARFRGYLNIGPDDPLNITLGLIGNDALTLDIEGQQVVWVNWSDGQWKKFRYVSFPAPGMYTFEVQWLTNLICDIDPFELVYAEGFLTGYGDYDDMCAHGTCTYGNGVPIPGFSVYQGEQLTSASDGGATSCLQCDSDADCSSVEVCNSAGICQ